MAISDPQTLSYRPEIDGLRAVAVVSVILYHAQFVLLGNEWFQGGFIGVDIFFVISGYLISRIIFSELQSTGSFSFTTFYERRARRILPMLFVVIFASFPFAWYVLLPSAFIQYAESILASLFFGSNFFFYFSTTEYGAESSLLKPFLHTWSLGVEEQFYLLFPCVAILAFRYCRQYFLATLVILTLLSLGFAEFIREKNSDLNFYLPFSRFWELLAGSILAFRELNFGVRSEGIGRRLFPTLGLILVGYSIWFFDGSTPHPSSYTLAPIVGTVLIIGYAAGSEVVSRTLGSKPFVWLGLISYSAYLWHFPVLAFARLHSDLSTSAKLALVFITLVLSALSYLFIEKPFRDRNKLSKRNFIAVSSVFSLSIVGACVLIIKSEGVGGRFNLVADTHEKMMYYRKEYWQDWSRFHNENRDLVDFERAGKTNVYVIGNSWAHDIANSISLSDQHSVQFSGMSGHLCKEFILPRMKKNHKDFARWKKRCSKNRELFKKIPLNTDLVVIADNIFREAQYDAADVKRAFESNISALRKSYIGPVAIVKGRPTWARPGFELMVEIGPRSIEANKRAQSYLKNPILSLRTIDNYYRDFFSTYDVRYLSLINGFCDQYTCKLFDKNNVLFFDKGHLTLEGAGYVSQFLISEL